MGAVRAGADSAHVLIDGLPSVCALGSGWSGERAGVGGSSCVRAAGRFQAGGVACGSPPASRRCPTEPGRCARRRWGPAGTQAGPLGEQGTDRPDGATGVAGEAVGGDPQGLPSQCRGAGVADAVERVVVLRAVVLDRQQDQQVGGVEAGTRRPHPGQLPLLGRRCAPQRDEHRPVPSPGGERVEGDDEFESPAQLPRRGAGRGDPDAVAEPGFERDALVGEQVRAGPDPPWRDELGRCTPRSAGRAEDLGRRVGRCRPERPGVDRCGPGPEHRRHGDRGGRVQVGEQTHEPWPAQPRRRDDPARDGVRPPERLLHPCTLHLGSRPPGRDRCARRDRTGRCQVARRRVRREERDGEAGQAGGRR